ncbi:MAG TPA: hypothetical protein VKY85_25260 [Candidatus Angelobacter sp.]|nr:hypothetical protein [Candidatus Angelobacter sp.]
MYQLRWMFFCLFVFLAVTSTTAAASNNNPANPQAHKPTIHCPSNSPNCADIAKHLQELLGKYSGHDEPAVGFYSNRPGSGNNLTTVLTIPTDPPTLPQQDGTGGTFNFQLHAAFWFSMVLCDTQSFPNFTQVCIPNTDANIFDNPDPNAPDFIGHHPGSAFLELQFYPPGGFNTCSDPTQWCVAMAIFSFNGQSLTGALNNADCQNRVSLEPANAAFLTTNGISQVVGDPLSTSPNPLFNTVPGQQFKMNPGDRVRVTIHDTVDGLKTEVQDLTTGITGSMTASIANGFAQVNFVPDPDPANPSVTCSSTPYAFHPQFSTSSEHTRADWTAHTVNIAFADEIGHYELCSAVDFEGGACIGTSPADPGGPDFDDQVGLPLCFSGGFLASLGLQPIGACTGGDLDFDGTPYNFNWPGTGNPATDALIHPRPIRFTAPQFRPREDDDDWDRDRERGRLRDFNRVVFETDTPLSEFATNPTCDVSTPPGTGCTNPPAGTKFYPIYSTTRHYGDGDDDGGCSWQFGGPRIPGTENNFGGTSTREYGGPLFVVIPSAADADHPNGTTISRLEDFRRVLSENPCRRDRDE